MKRSDYFGSIDATLHTTESKGLVKAFVESVKMNIPHGISHGYEIGCGYGLAAEQMLNQIKTLTLFDIDNQALDFIRWKFPPGTFELKNNNKIPQDSDFIYFFMSLHHIYDYKELVINCINHIVKVAGKGLAICELKPNNGQPFHKYEPSPYDGLMPEDFNFVHSFLGLDKIYNEMPTLTHHGIEYQCYSLIIKPL